MTIPSEELIRFGAWLVKNRANKHMAKVRRVIEREWMFSNGEDPNEIKSRKRGSIRRSFNRVISGVKFEQAVLKRVRNDFKLRTLIQDDYKAIIQESIRADYAYLARFEKSMHKQGLYVPEFTLRRKVKQAEKAVKSVKTVKATEALALAA